MKNGLYIDTYTVCYEFFWKCRTFTFIQFTVCPFSSLVRFLIRVSESVLQTRKSLWQSWWTLYEFFRLATSKIDFHADTHKTSVFFCKLSKWVHWVALHISVTLFQKLLLHSVNRVNWLYCVKQYSCNVLISVLTTTCIRKHWHFCDLVWKALKVLQ